MIMVTVFFLIMVLAPSGFAEKTVKTKYLEFSSQKEKPVNLASDYATLKSPSTGELPIHGFTICGSIQIHYFQGIQAFYTVRQNIPTKLWFSLYIYDQDITEEYYSPKLAYNGGEVYPNTEAKFSLRPHSWSHACTTINRNS